jgi:hypothetical protein
MALATVAAAVTLESTPGPFGRTSTGVGVTLLLVVLAYHHPRAASAEGRLSGPGRDAAFGAVVGLLAAMAISWLWSATVASDPTDCQTLGMAAQQTLAATQPEDVLRHRRLDEAYEQCRGEVADPWFFRSWVVLAFPAGLLHTYLRRRPDGQSTAPQPQDDRRAQGIA